MGETAGSKVTHILDHHVDLKAYPAEQLKESVVRFIGSACSLAILQMMEEKHVFPEEIWTPCDVAEKSFAYFYSAALVLDTYNFAMKMKGGKWNDDDMKAYEMMKQYYPLTDAYFDHLSAAKFNQELALENGFHGILVRDYKNYDLKGECYGEPFEGRMGIAVSVTPVKRVFNHFGYEQCWSEVNEYMAANGLSMFGFTCTSRMEDGKF